MKTNTGFLAVTAIVTSGIADAETWDMPMALPVFVLIALPELATGLPENIRRRPGG